MIMNEIFIKQFFSEKGDLSHSIDGYRVRQEQIDISLLIDEAITHKKKLIVEAGTGIGKTFAYLVPAFLSGGKIIISTATKNLQDQLFTKDIPMIRDALKVPVSLAMLKGRSNYLCHLRLENAMIEGAFMFAPALVVDKFAAEARPRHLKRRCGGARPHPRLSNGLPRHRGNARRGICRRADVRAGRQGPPAFRGRGCGRSP